MARDVSHRIIGQSHVGATPNLRYQASPARWELFQPSEQSLPVFDVESCGSVKEVGTFSVNLFAGEREARGIGGDFCDGGCVEVLVDLVW